MLKIFYHHPGNTDHCHSYKSLFIATHTYACAFVSAGMCHPQFRMKLNQNRRRRKRDQRRGDLTSHLLGRVHLDGVEDTPVGEVHVGAEGVGQQSSEVPVAVVPADEGEDDPRLLGGHHGREGALQARLGDHERHGPAGEPQGS